MTTTTPQYTLHYFGVRGKGELIRLCFHAAGQSFVDKRYSFEDWPAIKSDMPLKQMPVLETSDGQMYCQSLPIARYVAKKFRLMGETVEEELYVDMIVETFWTEIGLRIGKSYFGNDEEGKKRAKEENTKLFPVILERIESWVRGDFFLGDRLSLADLALIDVESLIENFGVEVELPDKLREIADRVKAEENIAAWLAVRPKTEL